MISKIRLASKHYFLLLLKQKKEKNVFNSQSCTKCLGNKEDVSTFYFTQ